MTTRLSTTSYSTSSMAITICYLFLVLYLILTGLLAKTVWSLKLDLDNNNTQSLSNDNNSSAFKLSENHLNGCPNCLSVASNRPLAERLKVEAIKKQILSKLNLPERPNITASIPRELVLEALRKAQLDTNGNNYHSITSNMYSISSVHSQQPDLSQSIPQQHNYHSTHQTSYQEPDSSNYISSSSDDYYGKTSEIIAFAEPGDKVNGHTLLVFIPPHDNIHMLEVTSATLWIQIRLRQLARNLHYLLRDHVITLYIFRIPQNRNISDSNGSNLELITSHKIKANRPGWKHIEIRDAIQKWFSTAMSANSKLTLLVDCVGCDSLIDIVLFESSSKTQSFTTETNTKINNNHNSNEQSNYKPLSPFSSSNNNNNNKPAFRHNSNGIKNGYRPFVVIATQTKISRRSRRHTLTCDSGTNQCCKQSLYVSFKELGWDDWIIAPKGYYANYCVGDCSKRRTPDTYVYFHSHVIEEYRNKNPYASITPCCAPTKLSAISLIYFDPELNIIKADLPKMVVEECGCT